MRPPTIVVAANRIASGFVPVMKWIYDCYRQFRQFLIKGYLRLHGVSYGTHLYMSSFPYCRRHPSATISIGNHVTILNKLSENPAGISHRSVLVAGPNATLKIGNHVGISGAIVYCAKEITIEDWITIG